MDAKEYLGSEVSYDKETLTFYNKDGFPVLDVDNPFTYYNFSKDEALGLSDKVGEFIKDAINEKLKTISK